MISEQQKFFLFRSSAGVIQTSISLQLQESLASGEELLALKGGFRVVEASDSVLNITFEDSLALVGEYLRQENNFYINLRFHRSISSSNIGYGYCFAVVSYLEIKIQRDQFFIRSSGTRTIEALHDND